MISLNSRKICFGAKMNIVPYCLSLSLKGNGYTFKGDNAVVINFTSPGKRSTLKGKNLLLRGANSFLL